MPVLEDLCDPEWVIRFVTGYIFHVNEYRIFGFLIDYIPDVPNTIFILAVSLLLAEYQLWPIRLKKPPPVLSIVIEGLFAQFWTNVARSLVWIPFTAALKDSLRALSKKVLLLNSKLKFHKHSFLYRLSLWLGSEHGFSTICMLLAIGVLIWVLHATSILDEMERMLRYYFPLPCESSKPKYIRPRVVVDSHTSTPHPSGNLFYKLREIIYNVLEDVNKFILQDENSEPGVYSELEQHQVQVSNLTLSGGEPVSPINDEHEQQ